MSATGLVCRFTAAVFALLLPLACVHAKSGDAIGSHTAKVNDVEIHYLAAGAGDKTPVILLHGYAETSRMWLPLMPKIDDGRTVIAPDLRGIGGSSKPESGYDKKTAAQDIHALAASLGFKKVIVVG